MVCCGTSAAIVEFLLSDVQFGVRIRALQGEVGTHDEEWGGWRVDVGQRESIRGQEEWEDLRGGFASGQN